MLKKTMTKITTHNQNRGFTLLEFIVSATIIAIFGLVTYTNWARLTQNQQLTNHVSKLQAALDTTRVKSVGVTPDNGGNYNAWGVFINFSDNTYQYGPYDTSNFNPSDSTNTAKLPVHLSFIRPPGISSGHNLLILFSKLTGTTQIYSVNPANNTNMISSWSDPLAISIKTSSRQQDITITRNGTTQILPPTPIN